MFMFGDINKAVMSLGIKCHVASIVFTTDFTLGRTNMHKTRHAPRSRKTALLAGAAVAALGAFTTNAGAVDPDKSTDRVRTATPIKHVIVVLAENSSFVHAFGTFRPRPGQHIANLLSNGIVNENGTPGRGR